MILKQIPKILLCYPRRSVITIHLFMCRVKRYLSYISKYAPLLTSCTPLYTSILRGSWALHSVKNNNKKLHCSKTVYDPCLQNLRLSEQMWRASGIYQNHPHMYLRHQLLIIIDSRREDPISAIQSHVINNYTIMKYLVLSYINPQGQRLLRLLL